MVIEREQLIKKINRDIQKKTRSELADRIGIPAMTLGRIISGASGGSMKTWETIAIYYYKIKKSA
jgi:DNA transposition AAA+ family ATPase